VQTGVFTAADFADRVERDQAMAAWLGEHDTELVVLAGYMKLLSPGFLRRFPERVINVHPALLPAFPGLRPIQEALEYGVKVSGVTVHFVDDGVDSGAVILQRAIEIDGSESADELLERLHTLEHELLPEAVRLIAAGALSLDPANPRRVVIDR
jgi:phosphoribosylglycinamide formyltransferase-1